MYFASLTEVPILEGLIKSGMGHGPALALLLAGPALSLPSMLVIRSVMGNPKAVVFVCLVIVLSTIAWMAYGTFFWKGALPRRTAARLPLPADSSKRFHRDSCTSSSASIRTMLPIPRGANTCSACMDS